MGKRPPVRHRLIARVHHRAYRTSPVRSAPMAAERKAAHEPDRDRDAGQVAINVRVRPDVRTRARRASIELGVPMRDMVEEALDAYLKRRGF